MNLIPISANVLINPDEICYISQKKTKGGTVIMVGIEGKEFELEIPLQQFYDSVGITSKQAQYDGQQHFAG